MLNFSFQVKGLIRFFIICLSCEFILLFCSFKTPEKYLPKSSKHFFSENVNIPPDFESIGSFKMDYETVMGLEGSWDRRLILKISYTITASGPKSGLTAYVATSHEDHATDELKNVYQLTEDKPGGSLTFDIDKEYLLGNNYIKLRRIRKYLNSLKTDPKLIKKFEHIRFTPYEQIHKDKNGKEITHVAFIVQAIGADGKPVKSEIIDVFTDKSNNVGGIVTNPSPPADPS